MLVEIICYIYKKLGSTHLVFLKNPYSPDARQITPIHCAVIIGFTQIVKILAPITENPNVPNKGGDIYLLPIHNAAQEGSLFIFLHWKKKVDDRHYNQHEVIYASCMLLPTIFMFF